MWSIFRAPDEACSVAEIFLLIGLKEGKVSERMLYEWYRVVLAHKFVLHKLT